MEADPMPLLYDQIGASYSDTRAADPRITAQLLELLALPTGSHLVDIGAGTGNYSYALAEAGYQITAVEPSLTMRGQARAHARLNWQAGLAEALPFADGVFAGAVMTLCMHHFSDWRLGLREALRVVGEGPLVIFAFDVDYPQNFWLFDYFPEFITIDQNSIENIPAIREFVEKELQAICYCSAFPLPRDLVDHVAAAGWARPEIYLEAKYRAGISSFTKLDMDTLNAGLARLQQDLETKNWHRKYGELLQQETADFGYLFFKIQKQPQTSCS